MAELNSCLGRVRLGDRKQKSTVLPEVLSGAVVNIPFQIRDQDQKKDPRQLFRGHNEKLKTQIKVAQHQDGPRVFCPCSGTASIFSSCAPES